ncbi:MAG: hypothetical protein Kow0092_24830 [Deferrisomatales bacterium]
MLNVVGNQKDEEAKVAQEEVGLTLDEWAREGARRRMMAALEEEVEDDIARHRHEVDEHGRRHVVRNGRGAARRVTLGAGTVEIRAPRVHDKRVDEDGHRKRFSSQILPR